MDRGVPDEAFATQPSDEKETVAILRGRNKSERKAREAGQLRLSSALERQLDDLLSGWRELGRMPEHTPDEIEAKKRKYLDFTQSENAWLLNQIAAIPIAQFYLPKTRANLPKFITEGMGVQFYFGGTSLLIVVGVAMDTVQQVESQLIMRHYDGFMKKTRIRGRRG